MSRNSRFFAGLALLALAASATPHAVQPAFAATCGSGAASYGGGAGTSGDPWQISDASHLLRLSNNSSDWGNHFVQTADVDLADCTGWTPIGGTPEFTGSYDGGGFSIAGFTLSNTSWYQGLFGKANGATIEGVNVVDASVSVAGYSGILVGYLVNSSTVSDSSVSGTMVGVGAIDATGGLVGRFSSSTISGSRSTASVSGRQYVGGLVGQADSGITISDSFATGAVSGTGGSVGGLVGIYGGATIRDSYSTGAVSGAGTYVGGLVGKGGSGSITRSYATGNVSVSGSYDYVGGLVGQVSSTSITNSYSAGNVSGSGYVGGAAGQAHNLTNVFSTGTVLGSSNVGGLAGASSGTVTDSFWDATSSGVSSGSLGNPKSTSELQTVSTFNDVATTGLSTAWPIVAGWQAFDSNSPDPAWGICDGVGGGYPFLLWQYTSDPCTADTPISSAGSNSSARDSGAPGIFLTVSARVGSVATGSSVMFGSYSVDPNSAYLLTVGSRNSGTAPRVLAQGYVNGGGHFEREVSLPALPPGAYEVIFIGYSTEGLPLRLTNIISVGAAGSTLSVTAESLQPFVR